jgi:hypothetical protein
MTGFNAFWFTHHLFVIVYTLLFVHGTCLYLSRKWYKKTVKVYTLNTQEIPMIIVGTFFVRRS